MKTLSHGICTAGAAMLVAGNAPAAPFNPDRGTVGVFSATTSCSADPLPALIMLALLWHRQSRWLHLYRDTCSCHKALSKQENLTRDRF